MDKTIDELKYRIEVTKDTIANGENIPQLLFEVLKNQKVIMETLLEIKPIINEH